MTISATINHYPLGDQAIVLSFGDVISEDINSRIRSVCANIDRNPIPGLIEYVPAYTTITIYYDPLITGYESVWFAMEGLLKHTAVHSGQKAVVKRIPVYYNGPDLADVAEHTRLPQEDVIRIHSEREYLVYMIGFVPGFPYLGGMDTRIAAPRKQVPRLTIEAGAVGIAGEQTGIYPIETPGGWQIIGQTPLQLFDIDRDKPSLLEVGDYVRFVPIGPEEFLQIREMEYGD